MPNPPDHLYKMPRLHKAFAVSAIMLALSFLWLLAADYFREWRRHQAAFTKLDIAKTEAEAEEALLAVDDEQLERIRQAAGEAETQLAERRRELREAERELGGADAERYRADQAYRFEKAEVDTLRYEYEAKGASADPLAARLGEELRSRSARLEQLRQEMLLAEAKVSGIRDRIGEMTSARDRAEKDHADLLALHDRLQTKLKKTRPNIWTLVRNAPFIDFTAPTQKITQVVVNDLTNDINFMEIPRIDRCVTCHVGINRPGFEDQPNPYRTHPKLHLFVGSQSPHAYEQFGCTTCHMGQDRATSFNDAVHWPNNEEQRDEWERSYGWHPPEHWDEPMLPREHLEASCRKCHKSQVQVPEGERINRALTLVERYGCYGCHKISGMEALPKSGPDLRSLASKVSEEWILKWLQEPRGFRPSTRMPHFWDLTNGTSAEDRQRSLVEIDAIAALLLERSKRAEHPRPVLVGDATRGEHLVDRVGCKGCHHVGAGDPVVDRAGLRAFGPELNQIGSKLDEGWLFAWLKDPQSISPTTRMPNLRLTDSEGADIAAYLMTLRNPDFDAVPVPVADAAVRRQMVAEWLGMKMPSAQAEAEAAAMAEGERRLFLGEKYLNRHGCFGCHLIEGYEKTPGVCIELSEWGSKHVNQLDFGLLEKKETNPRRWIEVEGHGRVDKIDPTRQAWAATKLLNPRVFDLGRVKKPDEQLKMPSFGLSEEDAKSLVTALLSLTKERVDPRKTKRLSPAEAEIEAGNRVLLDNNCLGCHRLGAEGGAIIESIRRRFEQEQAGVAADALALAHSPPNLHGEGGKVHPDWFFRFLKSPTPIRPWLEVRMPAFGLDDHEANAIITRFARSAGGAYPFKNRPLRVLGAADLAAARKMFGPDYFDCLSCHMQGARTPEGPPEGWAPDLAKARERLQPDWISLWLRDPQKLQPGTKMPTYYDPSDPAASAPPDILDGDPEKQIELLKDYVLHLGKPNQGG